MLPTLNPFVRHAKCQLLTDFSREERVGVDCRLFYVKNGGALIKVGGFDIDLIPESAVFIPPHTPYLFCEKGSGICSAELIVVNFDLTCDHSEYLKSHGTKRPSEIVSFPYKELPPKGFDRIILCKNAEGLANALLRITVLFLYADEYYRDFASAILKEVLLKMLSAREKRLSEPVRAAVDYIRGHGTEVLKNSDTASFLGYHPYYLSRLFKRDTGKTLKEYVVSFKLKNAAEKLASTNASVSAVATSCGFPDISYFSQRFKKEYGITPHEYRERERNSLFI